MRMDSPAVRGSNAVHRVLDEELAAARERGVEHPVVVDVGGGSGVWAVPLAVAGCTVTVVDPNPNALATLSRRAEDDGVADRVTGVAEDVDALADVVPAGSADIVLAHGLLEVVDDPADAANALATAVAPEGVVSVLVANRHAAALHRALAGRFDEARALLTGHDGVLPDDGDALLRRFDVDSLTSLLDDAGLRVAALRGDGIVSDSVSDPSDEDMTEFERVAASMSPLREIASRLHALARRAG
ncbi:methyltransferase domain-containing protein [Haloechinothrix salitolerans]|uniref:Methyltransferase domain-containing protein n=1 Tax=Haloechinothrix salitolerans TaxID=926830 RepID=A0ABW2C1R0_9PSEU